MALCYSDALLFKSLFSHSNCFYSFNNGICPLTILYTYIINSDYSYTYSLISLPDLSPSPPTSLSHLCPDKIFFFQDRVFLYSSGCPWTLSGVRCATILQQGHTCISFCRPSWLQTQRSACLCLPSTGKQAFLSGYNTQDPMSLRGVSLSSEHYLPLWPEVLTGVLQKYSTNKSYIRTRVL